MSNTNVGIKTSNRKSWFNGRKYHNNRNTNLSDSDFKDDECINIVNIINKDLGLTPKNLAATVVEAKTLRSDITRKLSANNSRLAKYEAQMQNMTNSLDKLIDNGEHGSKEFKSIEKKLTKKMLTFNKAKIKSEELETLRDSISAKKVDNTNKNKKNFVELSFSITKCPQHLRRDLNYSNDLLEVVKEFYNNLGLNMEIQSYSVHLDQSSPHVHLMGSYENSDSTFNKDLQKHFKKSFNYFSLNNSFNTFVREHKLLQKYEHVQNLETITRGGKWEYEKNLPTYKAKSKKLKHEITEEVKKIKPNRNKIGWANKSREEILEEQLIEVALDSALKGSISDKLVKSNEMLAKENEKANKALDLATNDAQLIAKQNIELKDKEKSINFYKSQQLKDRDLLEKRNKEISDFKDKYEPNSNSNNRSRKHK